MADITGSGKPDRTGRIVGAAFLLALIVIVIVFATGPDEARDYRFWVPLLTLIAMVWIFDRYILILRDIPPEARTAAASYSLGRAQMAFWTCLVVAALVYVIGMKIRNCSGAACLDFDLLKLDTNILILLGISGATGAAAMAVDIDKDRTAVDAGAQSAQAKSASGKLLDLIVTARASNAGAGEILALEKRLAEAQLTERQADLTIKRSTRDANPKDFFRDLLEDSNGNSLHRLQMIMFTLVTGVIFVTQVIGGGGTALPKIPTEILGLLGISNSLYVGFKIPGK